MTAGPQKQRIVDALRAVWSSLDDLLATLDDDQWRLPTSLPGWDVQANVAHIVGTEEFLLGRQSLRNVATGEFAHVHNAIGEMNEGWVLTFADRAPADVLARFREVTAERLGLLDSMSQENWETVGFTPAGEAPYGRFMQIRAFDCWMHEQDIRAALGIPGHESGLAVEVVLDEVETAMGFVVGKKVGTPDGASVTFDLIGDTGRRIHVLVDGRAAVVPQLPGSATVTLTMPIIAFTRLAGGRPDAAGLRDLVAISGDDELGRRVLNQLAYTI